MCALWNMTRLHTSVHLLLGEPKSTGLLSGELLVNDLSCISFTDSDTLLKIGGGDDWFRCIQLGEIGDCFGGLSPFTGEGISSCGTSSRSGRFACLRSLGAKFFLWQWVLRRYQHSVAQPRMTRKRHTNTAPYCAPPATASPNVCYMTCKLGRSNE